MSVSKESIGVADKRSITLLAKWFSQIIEPYLEQHHQSQGSNYTLELEIMFGRLSYNIPRVLYPITLGEDAQKMSHLPIDLGACLHAIAPWDKIVPQEWLPVSETLATINYDDMLKGMMVNLDELVLGTFASPGSPQLCAITCWTCAHHVNFDPVHTAEAIAAASENQERIRFEKLRVSHTDTSVPDTIWTIKKYKNAFATTHTEQEDTIGTNAGRQGLNFFNHCIVMQKMRTAAVTPFVSARSIWAAKMGNAVAGKSLAGFASFDVWSSKKTHCTKKRKVAAPSTFRSNFASLMDFSIYANSEEQVLIESQEGEIADASKAMLGLCANAERPSANTNIPKTLPILVVNASTYMPCNPVVSCRKSFYFSGSSGCDALIWRLDISFVWRPDGPKVAEQSLCDLMSRALAAKSLLEMGEYEQLAAELQNNHDSIVAPTVELEMECINVSELLLSCNGDYYKFAQSFCMAALMVQKILGKFLPKKIDSSHQVATGGGGLVPCELPLSVFQLKV